MNFKRFVLLPFCSIILLTLSFCKKSSDGCNSKQTAYYALSDSDLMIVPYQEVDKDTMVFRRNENDSILVIFKERYTGTQDIFVGPPVYDPRKCKGDYTTIEYNYTNFTSYYGYLKFQLDGMKYLFMTFDLRGNGSYAGFGGLYKFKNDSLISNSEGDSSIIYFPQIVLGGIAHNKVYELHSKKHSTGEEYWNTTAYYSVEEGLVGFKNLYGLWYLE